MLCVVTLCCYCVWLTFVICYSAASHYVSIVVVCVLLFGVCCVLSVNRCWLFVACCVLRAWCCLWCVRCLLLVGCQLLLFGVHDLLSLDSCSLFFFFFAICWLS